MRGSGLWVVLALAIAAGVAFRMIRARAKPPAEAARFVDPAMCFGCHAEQTRNWRGSHHERAMQPATDATVLGDFNDVDFKHHGVFTRFSKRTGRYFIFTEGPDGELREFPVRFTFGVEPLQQYLLELPGGKLQAFTIAWDTKAQRWFSLEGATGPQDPLHWTGLAYNWNHSCAECHSTAVRKNYDDAGEAFHTTFSEVNVGCQGCHGPGSAHVEWARRIEETREEYHPADPKGLAVKLGGKVEVDHCARCHARRSTVSKEYRYGERFLDHYEPSLLEPELYHADGQMLEEVYNDGPFQQSRMFAKGVRCTDCHEPHTTKVRLKGNLMCQRCHQDSPPPQFPTLKKKEYDTEAHHFHEPGKPGSFCVDCHMPVTTYMVVDPRHDHGFRVPRPDLTVKVGVPNACNGCHKDKSPAWAAEAVDRWYPRTEARPPHFAEAFALGRAGRPEAAPLLAGVFHDPEQPAIVRATALEMLVAYGDLDALAKGTRDEDPLVRAMAARGLRGPGLEPARKKDLLSPLLKDPVRLVRVEASRSLAGVPGALPNRDALTEFRERQDAMLDRPDAHLNLGSLAEDLGDRKLAEKEYRKALEILPHFWPACANLARLLSERGRNGEAQALLRDAVDLDAENGEAWYGLGLLLAEEGRERESADALREAARRIPRGRVFYNYGLALQKLDRLDEARDALVEADRLSPDDGEILYALALVHAQRREPKLALPYARRALALRRDADTDQLVRQLEAQAGH